MDGGRGEEVERWEREGGREKGRRIKAKRTEMRESQSFQTETMKSKAGVLFGQ